MLTIKRLIKFLLIVVPVILIATYVMIYLRLRNRGVAEWKQYGDDCFLYDQVDRVMQSHDMSTHEFRFWVFSPLNYFDRHIFGGPEPIRCLMFDIE